MNMTALLTKAQAGLKKDLAAELMGLGRSPIIRKGFLYAEGDVPVLLIAHLDTVHKQLPSVVCSSPDSRILMAPEGVGGDDRAGVYIVLELLKKFKCHVLFCEDEEIGGIGAQLFVESGISPIVNYIVELDRRGKDDAVFYGCDNPEFTQFICSYGFREEYGSFSDISVIAPALGIAAVNLSSGYYCAHTRHEYIDMVHVRQIICRVSNLLTTHSTTYSYVPAKVLAASIRMSPLPDGSFIDTFDEDPLATTGDIYIDSEGELYAYDHVIEMARQLWPCIAYEEDGTPASYDHAKSLLLPVLDDYF